MSGSGTYTIPSRTPAPSAVVSTRHLARQPILNIQGHIFAYELLFRGGADAFFIGDGELASRTMIDNMIVFGYGKLTAGLPAFINCTADILTGDYISVLPSSMTVLEVLEDVEPTPKIINACRRQKAEGYRIALDDFVYSPSLDPLIRIADFIKIDYRNTTASTRHDLMTKLDSFAGAFVAEKVETQQEYEQACKEGFLLFQGFYFCKPNPLKEAKVPANSHVHLQLLQLLQEHPLNLNAVSAIVKSEPSLTYRLLRVVNSPVCAMRQEIRSIKTALLEIGDDFFRRIATLAIVCELSAGRCEEVVRMALIRARFCETAATHCSLDSTELYLLGLFSLLDAMLQKPMSEAISPLHLRDPMREALLGVNNSLRCPLYWLESHESGDFARCDALATSHGFAPEQLAQDFTDAAQWADELLSAVE